MIQFWWMALRNLRRNLKRNIATGSAIAFGFAGIILLAGYSYRVSNYLRAYTVYVIHTGHLAVFAKDGLEKYPYKPALHSLTLEDQTFIEGIVKQNPKIDFFEKQIRGQGLAGNGCASFPFIAQGIQPEIDQRLREHEEVKYWMPQFQFLRSGQSLGNYPTAVGAMLMTKGLAIALGKTKLHDEIPQGSPLQIANCAAPEAKSQMSNDANIQLLSGSFQGNISAIDAELVGTYTTGFQETDNSGIITGYSLLQKLFQTDNIAQYAIWLKNIGDLSSVETFLKEKFRENKKEYEIVRWSEARLSPFYSGSVQFIDSLVIFVSIVLASIITLSVLNSATMTILERSQEIGMYRAMGFRRSHIHILYLQESAWLAAISLLAGAVGGIATIYAVNHANIHYSPPGVSGGMQLVLLLNWRAIFTAALSIYLLVLLATGIAVKARVRLGATTLLGGNQR